MTGNAVSPADAAVVVLESSSRRAVLTYLFEHPAATRQDIIRGIGTSPTALSRSLADLETLGYVTVELGPERTWADHFTAHLGVFVSDLAALRDRYGDLLAQAEGAPREL